jgi:hypothetical protein
MKRINWQITLALGLVLLSTVLYLAHFVLFRDPHHIFIYFVGDVAFIPIEVLLVTVVIHQLLSRREKRTMLQKMNMVIGAFFSEVGTQLLRSFADLDPQSDTLRNQVTATADWSDRSFRDRRRSINGHDYNIDSTREDLGQLRRFLLDKRGFLLVLLENPNLLEHDSFTDLLWAVFHLTEELAHRGDLTQITDTDLEHLVGDIKRAYKQIVGEWLDYVKHLNDDYPYLFSLAVRTNPFDPEARPEVR